jgi:hypothetical protein
VPHEKAAASSHLRKEILVTSKPNPTTTNKVPPIVHPGMFGDGTEEQNLNEPGDPSARIKQDEVDAAFAKAEVKKP